MSRHPYCLKSWGSSGMHKQAAIVILCLSLLPGTTGHASDGSADSAESVLISQINALLKRDETIAGEFAQSIEITALSRPVEPVTRGPDGLREEGRRRRLLPSPRALS